MKVTINVTRHSVTLASRTTALVSLTQTPSMPLTVSDALAIPLRMASSILSVELEMISIFLATDMMASPFKRHLNQCFAA